MSACCGPTVCVRRGAEELGVSGGHLGDVEGDAPVRVTDSTAQPTSQDAQRAGGGAGVVDRHVGGLEVAAVAEVADRDGAGAADPDRRHADLERVATSS